MTTTAQIPRLPGLRGLGSSGSPGNSGFSRGELLALALVFVVVFLWGFRDVDREGLDEPSMRHKRFPSRPAPTFFRPPPPPELAGDPAAPLLADRGREVFEANGCELCHSIDGSEKIGPSLAGIWNTEQPLVDGSFARVDTAYVHESVIAPQAKIVQGFDGAMPTYEGLVTTEDLDALADYIRSLR